MKILQLVPYYAPAWGYGGPPKVMFEIGKELVKRGHEVSVYTTDAFQSNHRMPLGSQVLEGVKIHYLKNVSNSLAWSHKKFIPIGLKKLLRKTLHEFDVVHISATRTVINLQAYPLLKQHGSRYFVDAHGSLPAPKRWKRIPGKILDVFFVKKFLRDAATLVAQTNHEAELFKGFVPKANIQILPLPINMEEFCHLPPKGVFRKKYAVGQNEVLLLFLGRIEERKGLDFLVSSFRDLKDRMKYPVRLGIVGLDCGYLDSVRSLVRNLRLEKHVFFTGPLYGTDRIEAYIDADIFTLTPGYYEETSVAALEACACSTPCVLTVQTEIPMLESYKAGFVIQYGDNESFVRSVRKIVESGLNGDHWGQNARRLIEERFELKQVVTKFESLLGLRP